MNKLELDKAKEELLRLLKSYVKAGLSPIAVNVKTKAPYISGWQKHHTSTDEIEGLIKAGHTNFGIVCGEPSGNLEILDFDDYRLPGSFEEWKKLLSSKALEILNGLPITRTQHGGFHVLYRAKVIEGNKKLALRPYDIALDGEPEHNEKCGSNCNGGDGCKAKPDKTFIETRGEGGQAVEPPSSGYTLLQGDFTDIPCIDAEIRDEFFLVARILSKIKEKENIEPDRVLDLPGSPRPGDDFNANAIWDSIVPPWGWKKFKKKGTITYWTRPGKDDGVSAATNFYGNDLLHVFSSNAYPFEAGKSYTKFTAHTFLNYGLERKDFSAAASELAGQEAVAVSKVIDGPIDQRPKTEEIEEKLRKMFFIKKNATKAVYHTAKYLVQLYNVKTVGKTNQTREIYVYTNGIYIPGLSVVKGTIQKILRDVSTTHLKNEIVDAVKDLTLIDRDSFVPDKSFINFKNGIYNINTREIVPHSPEYLFLHQIPVMYQNNAECPAFTRFLTEVLEEESTFLIQEWFGYALYRSYFLKKALICVGERDTGKTTLLRVHEKFLGTENISGVSLQKISSEKFALSNLYNKHANVYDDLSFKDINDNGTFKMLTGGGKVTAEIKFGDQFQFGNYAKLTFTCNKIPNIIDTDDEAYFSRWLLVRFEHKSEAPDKFLVEKMTTDSELSGIVNFALKGLYRLLKAQEFCYKKSPDEIKKEMSMSASPLAQFVFTELEVVSDPDVYITKDDMHQEFVNYAKENDLPVISKEALGKMLRRYIKVSDAYRSIKQDIGKAKQVACWLGVKFKDSKRTQPENKNVNVDPLESIFNDLPPK